MSVTIPPTKFWIICREETSLTQKLTQEINDWQVSGVRARIGHKMSLAVEATLAQSDHVIFISLCDYPCAQIQVNPVSTDLATAVQSPASFLNTLRKRHGKSPNAWWFQLPTTEVRQQGIKHIPEAHTLSQALSKIELFVRNHHSRYQTAQAVLSAQNTQSASAEQSKKILQVA